MKENEYECSVNSIHIDSINKAKKLMPSDDKLYDMADLFKIFSDSTRIKIISALFESELCVCDIACVLNMNQSSVSHQLKILRQSKLVKYRKSGKSVFYSLNDDHVKGIFNMGFEHVSEND